MPYESRCRPTSPPTTAAPQFSVPVDVASHTGATDAKQNADGGKQRNNRCHDIDGRYAVGPYQVAHHNGIGQGRQPLGQRRQDRSEYKRCQSPGYQKAFLFSATNPFLGGYTANIQISRVPAKNKAKK